MKYFCLLLCFLMLCFSIQAKTRKNMPAKEPAKPTAIKVDGIPERFPVELDKQRVWFLRWFTRGKVPRNMLPKFIVLLEGYESAASDAISKEEDRPKPRHPRIKYLEKMIGWYQNQKNIVQAVNDAHVAIFPLLPSKDPVDLKKKKELEDSIKEKISEFKKVYKQKPPKP